MERNKLAQALTVENFITNWNGDFPDHPLVAEDLKKPHSLIGALFLVLDRLGIDRDAVLAPPPEGERNENMQYYWDLIPVINMTRIINHLVSVMPQMKAKINIAHFLQPVAHTSHSILLLLFNLMLFNEERLRGIAESEQELFSKSDQVRVLEDKKNKLLEKLNEQAEEKGKRADRVEKLEYEIKQYEEELKKEKEAYDIERQELEAILKKNQKLKLVLEQKRTQKESLLTDIENKKEQRVYDADEIKAKAAQAVLNVQDADEKLNSLQAKLLEKENNLKNLQIIKPQIDTTNNVLQEVMKLSESLKEYETGDLDSDSKDGELYVLQTTLQELQAQLADLSAAHEEAATKHEQAKTKRQQERMLADNMLHEAEEKDKQSRERCNKAMQRTTEIKESIKKYEAMKAQGVEEVAKIKADFTHEIKAMDEALLCKVKDVEKNIENKLRNK